MILNDNQKEAIREQMNPEGSNYKDCNWFKVLSSNRESITVEVGFWITVLNCKPLYKEEVRTFNTLSPTK